MGFMGIVGLNNGFNKFYGKPTPKLFFPIFPPLEPQGFTALVYGSGLRLVEPSSSGLVCG